MNIHTLLTQPGAYPQPAYWAVPSGSNPAGAVSVSYAGSTGGQVQNPGQAQVWTHPWLFNDQIFLLTFTWVTKFSNQNCFRIDVPLHFIIGETRTSRLLHKWIREQTHVFKPRPNDGNISTQHVPTLLAQHLQAPAKRWQQLNAAYRNIVGNKMLRAFGHHVATCCDMLGIENRTSAHAQTQHCVANLAKRLQHHATSTNVAWKIWPVSNLSQQHPTCRSTSQHGGQTRAICCSQQCCDMLRWHVTIVWPGLKSHWCSEQI